MEIICPYCREKTDKSSGHVTRAIKLGRPIYCNRICAGLGRRSNLTIDEKKQLKSEYDRKYRELNQELLKPKKSEYHKKTYDPIKAAIIRKERMPKHVEYCRQPEYRKKKKDYDKIRFAKLHYGEFWESHLLITEIQKEYNDDEVRQENNLHNKSQKRKKECQTQTNQPYRLPI